MYILLSSRDRKFIRRIRRIYNDGVTTVMVIPVIYWLGDGSKVSEVPDVVLFDIEGLEPKIWPKNVAHLRKDCDLKVIVVDRRANCRRTVTAFKNYAVNYLSKAKRVADAKVRKAVTEAFRAGLPLLPSEH
ncbi:MAG: hypothetical protein AAB486_02695 [Patescibacteria group bacterium]